MNQQNKTEILNIDMECKCDSCVGFVSKLINLLRKCQTIIKIDGVTLKYHHFDKKGTCTKCGIVVDKKVAKRIGINIL